MKPVNGGSCTLSLAERLKFSYSFVAPTSNYLGNQAWTLGLDWSHKDDFNGAEVHDWKGAGLARTSNGLTFLQVYDAGHMVPSDQPEISLDMLKNFVSGGDF